MRSICWSWWSNHLWVSVSSSNETYSKHQLDQIHYNPSILFTHSFLLKPFVLFGLGSVMSVIFGSSLKSSKSINWLCGLNVSGSGRFSEVVEDGSTRQASYAMLKARATVSVTACATLRLEHRKAWHSMVSLGLEDMNANTRLCEASAEQ